MKKKIAVLLTAVFGAVLVSAETLQPKVDLCIVVDAASSLEEGWSGVKNWLIDTALSRMLRSGDTFTLVISGGTDKDEAVFTGVLSEENIPPLKDALRALPLPPAAGNAAALLAKSASRPKTAGAVSSTMLISGMGFAVDSPLLKYSRTENFAFWRLTTVGADVEKSLARN